MKTFIVDSFTNRPFAGNPAGVCHVTTALADETMQQIAMELGLSETAFVRPLPGDATLEIRYFSPKMEIPLCGHATLAAAKVWFAATNENTVHFVTGQNLALKVERSGATMAMELPAYPTHAAEAPPALLEALGLSSVLECVFNEETRILMLVIEDPDEIARLAPDFGALVRSHDGLNGVLITAPSGGDGFDVHVRFFWPWSGTDEDPVTGGIQTFLAPYWAERLGKSTLRVVQSSARTGTMEVKVNANSVKVRGEAVIVFEGECVVA